MVRSLSSREGAVDRRDRRGGVGGGRGVGGRRGRRGAVALDVELEEVEERAGDEGAEDEPAPALHHPLQRHHDAHPAVRPRRSSPPPLLLAAVARFLLAVALPHGSSSSWARAARAA